ncbi:amidase [Pigmentiphaga kullae]|uniref:Aspartyl-tRNA(Asn)/glutamyl-tRNA(Gln) amidotransferase subunit A n=1 Tax=Pigmentiphaga kullae TaxID=151784 RepID=A0A4V2F2H2_9BURK|nr:amidase [Pigmentiphaga kullae]RZS78138.1 aspartyl-tRNA(Asn)/glutamyl-tRNA(Gln) amidotransferase subunit A [Pigmentiphaga kullae]
MPPLMSLEHLSAELDAGRLTSRELVEACLARIADPSGQGARVYVAVDADGARRAADAVDAARARGERTRRLAGIPISIKDLFDIEGQVTTAGSRVLADAPPAARDAVAVARLREAGFVVMGRTNMTEFAYSGLGLNPHYGTPLNPYDRQTGRIPGGSSSGAAVSVTDGMAAVGLGTDTGGSCRIPAALTGLTGFKPTAARVPATGAFPLSTTLDSIGGIGHTVNCCALVDAILSGEPVYPDEHAPLAGLRVGVPQTLALDGMDGDVGKAFQAALQRLSQAGAAIVEAPFAEFSELAAINAKGGYTAAESYPLHRDMMARHGGLYDPRVKVRIEKGAQMTVQDIAGLHARRADWIRRTNRHFETLDVIACPTVPVIAPTVRELADDEAYGRANLLVLRNPTFINFLDGCAISLPCHEPGAAPVGLMLAAPGGQDRRLLAAARAVEALLAAR